MRYDIRKILSTTALALVLSLATAAQSYAQGVVSLNDSAKDSADEIPDEISLFGDDSADVLTPAKPVAKPLPVDKAAAKPVAAKPSPAAALKKDNNAPVLSNNGVKPASNVKSAADLLKKGNAPSPAAALNAEAPSKPAVPNIPAVAKKTVEVVKQEVKTVSIPAPSSSLDSQIVEDIDDDVFDQMSDLEKQTAILNLELRKEQVKSNIEALKSVQEKAKAEEEAKKEAERRKKIEWENEQEKKILQEKQKLKNLDVLYEKARQEKLLKSYKNKMLEDKQSHIQEKAAIYEEVAALKDERQKLINDFKGRFIQLTKLADEATNEVIKVRDNYAKTISDLQTQISILQARLEASERSNNPFADSGSSSGGSEEAEEENVAKLSDLYAIMEVRGKGNTVAAKLINDSGVPFMVKVGTVLQTGHIVDEISPTHVRADKEGNKEYLYFSAGGVLDKEPIQNEELKVKVSPSESKPSSSSSVVSSQGIPGVASEMTVR